MCHRNLMKVASSCTLTAWLLCGLAIAAPPANPSTETYVSDIRNEPKPIPEWTAILPKDVHMFEVFITGWTVFSLQAADESPLNIHLFDQSGSPLASFDSTGCGYLLQLDKPQPITVVIVNGHDSGNEYHLDVLDS